MAAASSSRGAGRVLSKITVSLRTSGNGKEKEDEALRFHLPATKRPFNAILYGDMVQRGFALLYGETKISDVTLVLGQDARDKLPVHRIVLSVWSEVFRALVEKAPKNAEVVIPLEKEDDEYFKLMLKHMYTGETDFINGENVLPLMSIASYFGIHSLKETCGELLGELVSDDNLFFFLDVVDKYEVKSLEAACGSHLAEHFQDLATGGKLDDLEPSTWAEIVKTEDIRVKSEEALFETVLHYANKFKNNKDARDQALTIILPHIRFPFMTPRFLVQSVEGNDSIRHLPIVQDLLHEAYRYRVNPASVKTTRTKPRKGHRFDAEQCHPNITLSDDMLKATLNSSVGWCNVRGMMPFTPDNPYVEFKVENGQSGQLMLGVVAGTVITTGYGGQNTNGWTYYSSGQVYNNSSTPATGQTYASGDSIGVFVEFNRAMVHFYKNGIFSACVSNVTISDSAPLYPHASFNQMGTSVSFIQYATIPNDAKAKSATATTGKKKRTALTSSTLGRAYADEDDNLFGSEEAEAIDGATFIKRFLRFKF